MRKLRSSDCWTSMRMISPRLFLALISTRLNLSFLCCWLPSLSRSSVMVTFSPRMAETSPWRMVKSALSLNTNAQIIGTFILSYHTANLNDASESLFYEFEVFDPEGDAYPNCFTGNAITNYNYPPQPDSFTVYNWGIDIPSTYPYHLFDNIAPGTVNLETCVPLDSYYPPYIMIALRCGFTIYANYCGS